MLKQLVVWISTGPLGMSPSSGHISDPYKLKVKVVRLSVFIAYVSFLSIYRSMNIMMPYNDVALPLLEVLYELVCSEKMLSENYIPYSYINMCGPLFSQVNDLSVT